MSEAALKELLAELRRMRSEASRSDEEMWSAIDEIRDLLAARGDADANGNGSPPREVHGAARAKRSDYRRLKRELRSFLGCDGRGKRCTEPHSSFSE